MADEPNKLAQMIPVEIEAEMKKSYLDYAMSVIVARAIPDVRDGLKPVQRRILVAMNDLGLASNRGYRKCAKICGDTSGNYHPHGEAVIYPTLVHMAQPWAMREKLVDGHIGGKEREAVGQLKDVLVQAAAEAQAGDAECRLVDEL